MVRRAHFSRTLFWIVTTSAFCLGTAHADEPTNTTKRIGGTLTFDVINEPSRPKIDTKEFSELLNKRLRDYGKARPIGENQIAVDVYGDANKTSLYVIRRRIGFGDEIEFRVTADPKYQVDKPIVALALKLPANETIVEQYGRPVAEWVPYSVREFGNPKHEDVRIVKRLADGVPQALILIDFWNVTNEYITAVGKGQDDRGHVAVNLMFNHQGAGRLKQLTSVNRPNAATGARRYLGIVLDKRLISAPSIETTVSKYVQISGRNMTEAEVDNLVMVLEKEGFPIPLKEVQNSPNAP
jgi:hypothetical protein